MSLIACAPFDWAAFELGFSAWCGRQDYPYEVVERGVAHAREHYPEGCDLSFRQLADRVSS